MTASVPALLRAYGLRPRKELGQNFLVDRAALARIAGAADLCLDDVVVEVGAGLGTLTRVLAARAGRVIALELDDHLVEILRSELAMLQNVEIVHKDVLSFAGLGFDHRGFKVVANLPYYITSAVLRHFLERKPRPAMMVVTVQEEVAQRMVAAAGKMSLLAVSVQLYGEPRIVARIPAGAFYPRPSVDSAVVRIDVPSEPRVAQGDGLDEALLFRVARAGFSQRRKTLRNSLSAGLQLDPGCVAQVLGEIEIDPQRRAQTLSLQEWADATDAFSGLVS